MRERTRMIERKRGRKSERERERERESWWKDKEEEIRMLRCARLIIKSVNVR